VESCALIESTGALIYSIRTHRYLFLLRAGARYSNTWGLPGGKVDAGETVSEGLIREILEELGGTIDKPKLIPIEKFTSDNGNFAYHTFLISIEEEFVPILNYEHRGYCWVSLEDHPKPLHPGVWRTINFTAVMEKIKTLEKVL
jgi:8-oxo-dGTP pyrophosphatase MutT (NUDIX family)